MEKIHIYLKTELDRLKISAAQAARDTNEPDSQGLRDVLSGRKRLTAELLGALVTNTGIDALYVLTGIRSGPIAKPIPSDEQMWLDCYREWDAPVKKRELRRAMGVLSEGATDIPKAVPSAIHIGKLHGQNIEGNQTNHGPMTFGASPPTKAKKPSKS